MQQPSANDISTTVAATLQHLQDQLKQRDQQLAALHASSSWRLTAPLRWAGRVAKGWLNKPAAAPAHAAPVLRDYAEWIRQFDSPNAEVSANMRAQIDGFAVLPLFSILMPVVEPKPAGLEAAINSVRQQIYPNWELCIAASSQTSAEIRTLLARCAQAEPRIKVAYVAADEAVTSSDLAVLCNHALAMVSVAPGNPSVWVLRMNAIDLIANEAIFTLARVINENLNGRIIYADEDVLDAQELRSDPYFKCGWNLDLHLSHNLIGRFGLYRTALVQQVGGYQLGVGDGPGDAMDFDLSLRCVALVKPEQIAHLPQVLFHARQDGAASAAMASDAGTRVLDAHCRRQGIAATAENLGHGYRLRYALPEVLPLVSLIIPTRNGVALLRQCIDSIQQKTTYRNFEMVIVDNGSDDPATLDYFKSLGTVANMRILRIDAPFNYSALNNAAVKVAKGELIGLINNDIEAITPDWLGELVSHALRPGVGAVGARLWFPDDTLQHGGVVLGIHGWAAHAHNHFPRGSLGYKGRMALVQNFSAVTGACLLVRKSSYLAVGGLNEDALKISCNDVDFCLKLQRTGLRHVWTPFADLYHHESATRGFEDTPAKKARFAGELAYMQRHWAKELQNDPAYSPNLTLNAQDFGLAWPPRGGSLVRPTVLQPGMPPLYERLATLSKGQRRIAYFAENVHSSTFRYRAANMAEVLNAAVAEGDVQTSAACFFSSDLHHTASIVHNADGLVISRARYDAGLAELVRQFKAQGKRVWFDMDDWVFDTRAIDLIIQTLGQEPDDEVLDYWYGVVGRMAQALRLCDGVITTNAYLADKLRQFVDVPVSIAPNFINQEQLRVSMPLYQRKLAAGFPQGDRIKLGYFSGSASHNLDFALIVPALEAVMAADPRVELVLVGHVDMAAACGSHSSLTQHFASRITQHGFTDYLTLQQLIAGVDFNLVPLQSNDFTHCKSELKYFDAAVVGTLSIASPTFAYAQAIRHGENGYLAADDQWEAVIRQAIAARSSYPVLAVAAYQDVQRRFVWSTQRTAVMQALKTQFEEQNQHHLSRRRKD